MMKSSNRIFFAAALILVFIGGGFLLTKGQNGKAPAGFDGERAYTDVAAQLNMGPRIRAVLLTRLPLITSPQN